MRRISSIVSGQGFPGGATVASGGETCEPSHAIRALAARPDLIWRWVVAIVAEERSLQTGVAPDRMGWREWTRETRVDEEGLGADSLARLEIIARLNMTFKLSETGIEDYLVTQLSLGEWCDLVACSLELRRDRDDLTLTFLTSGSTGTPTKVNHSIEALAREVVVVSAIVGTNRRILAAVPPHHIYGFLYTILMPALLDIPVIDARGLGPGRLLDDAIKGDLVVASPYLWQLAFTASQAKNAEITGLTSTGPSSSALWRDASFRLGRLVELFGSTETSGLGWRDEGTKPFSKLPHLGLEGGNLVNPDDGSFLPVQDILEWDAEGRFHPVGRRDGAVQVAGVNVFPTRIRDLLGQHPGVAECAVRPDRTGRLKAFVVPRVGWEEILLSKELQDFIITRMRTAERPQTIEYGTALPYNELGKLTDW